MDLLATAVDQLRARVLRHYGTVAAIRANGAPWVDDLYDVVMHFGIPWRAPTDDLFESFDDEEEAFTISDWWGSIELWPDSPDAIWVARLPYVDTREFQAIALAFAPSQAQLDAGLLRAYTQWRAWRRVAAEGRDSCGQPLELRPVAWEELYLPDRLLSDLRLTVEAFAVARPDYEAHSLPYRRGLLFHGPPGNGKTMTVRAIVTALGWPAIVASSADLVDDSIDVEGAFEEAASTAPSILVFEDADTLLDSSEIGELLSLLDGFTAREGMLVIATTNHPEVLDRAITSRPSRFDRVYEFADPEYRERLRYLVHHLGHLLRPKECEALAKETEGFSMAFLRELFVSAQLAAVHRGATRPTPADVHASFSILKGHRRSAKRRFNPKRPPGFGKETE